MARYSKVQSDFSGGLISDYILGRLDIKRVANSARVFKNFFPSLQGPAVFRSGFKHVTSNSTIATLDTSTVAGQADSNRTAGTYNGVSSTSSGFGAGATFDVVVDAGTGDVSALTLVSGGQGYAVGETITIADTQLGQAGTAAPDLTFKVNTVSLEPTSAYKSVDVTLATDVPYRAVFEPSKIKVYNADGVLKDTVAAPYSEAVIPDLRFSSETDALYITHGLYRPAKLTADLVTVARLLTVNDGNRVVTIDSSTVASQADSNRTAGTYNGVASTSSGSGTGATFNVVVDASTGDVSTLTLVSGGKNYSAGDTITIADTELGQTGSAAPNLTFTVATIANETGVTLVTSDGFQLSSGLEVQGDDSWTLSDLEFDFEPILSPELDTKFFKISSNRRIVKLESAQADFATIRAAGDGNWENYYVEYEAEGEKFLGKVIDAGLRGNYTEVTDPTADGKIVYVEPVESVVDIQDNAAQLYLLDSNEVDKQDTTSTPLTGPELDKALDLDGVPRNKIHLRCDTIVFNKGFEGAYIRVGDDRRNNNVVVGQDRTTTRWLKIKEHRGLEDHPVDFFRGVYSAQDYTSGAVYKAYGKLVKSPLYMKGPDVNGSMHITNAVLLNAGNRTFSHVTRLGEAAASATPVYPGNADKDLFGNLSTAKQFDVVECETTPHIESGDKLVAPAGDLTITEVANDVLLNSNTAEFTPDDVGRHCRGRLPSGLVFLKIIAVNSATQVRAELLSPVPRDSRTLDYENDGEFEEFNKGAWYVDNYPRTVTKFEQRRIFGGTYKNANNLFFSQAGIEESFKTAENDGEVLDTSGITYELDNSTAGIRWLVASRDLVVGTTGGLYRIVPNQYQFGISPKTIRIELTEEEPCNDQGESVGSSIFYPDQSGTRLMEYKYDANLTNSSSNDVSKLVYPTFINDAIKQIAYQHTPQPRMWVRTNGNKLFCLSYHRQEEFYAWSEHTISGSEEIYDISVLHRGAQGELDQLWAIVKRGSSVHTEALSQTDQIQTTVYPFLDSHITITKPEGSDISVNVSSRFAVGDTVSVIQDGQYIGDQVVQAHPTGGVITISNQSTTQNLVVGTKYEGELKMMFPTWDGSNKPAYGSDNARIISLKPFLINSWSYSLGVKDSLTTNQVHTTYGSTGFTGFDKERPVSGSTFGAENVPTIKHSEPYPLTIASIVTKTDLN